MSPLSFFFRQLANSLEKTLQDGTRWVGALQGQPYSGSALAWHHACSCMPPHKTCCEAVLWLHKMMHSKVATMPHHSSFALDVWFKRAGEPQVEVTEDAGKRLIKSTGVFSGTELHLFVEVRSLHLYCA